MRALCFCLSIRAKFKRRISLLFFKNIEGCHTAVVQKIGGVLLRQAAVAESAKEIRLIAEARAAIDVEIDLSIRQGRGDDDVSIQTRERHRCCHLCLYPRGHKAIPQLTAAEMEILSVKILSLHVRLIVVPLSRR